MCSEEAIHQGGNRELYKSRRNPAGGTDPTDSGIHRRGIHLYPPQAGYPPCLGTGNGLQSGAEGPQ